MHISVSVKKCHSPTRRTPALQSYLLLQLLQDRCRDLGPNWADSGEPEGERWWWRRPTGRAWSWFRRLHPRSWCWRSAGVGWLRAEGTLTTETADGGNSCGTGHSHTAGAAAGMVWQQLGVLQTFVAEVISSLVNTDMGNVVTMLILILILILLIMSFCNYKDDKHIL